MTTEGLMMDVAIWLWVVAEATFLLGGLVALGALAVRAALAAFGARHLGSRDRQWSVESEQDLKECEWLWRLPARDPRRAD